MSTLNRIGQKLKEKRGRRGVREVAKEIGISPSTLSRVENDHIPDLETFGKLCSWLGVDPSEFLGGTANVAPKQGSQRVAVHFKKKDTLKAETATALAELILLAQRSMEAQEG